MRKIQLLSLATAAVSMAFASAAHAAAILTYGSANPINVSFNGSALNLNDNNTTVTSQQGFGVATGQTVTFTGLTAGLFTQSAGTFDLSLSAGTFNIGGLLTGTFSSADLTGSTSGVQGDLAFNGVLYTGGSWLPANFSKTVGTALGTEFNLPSPTTWASFISGTTLSPFTGSDGTTATGSIVTSAPEPASLVSFGIALIALVAMTGFAKRTKQSNTI